MAHYPQFKFPVEMLELTEKYFALVRRREKELTDAAIRGDIQVQFIWRPWGSMVAADGEI